MNLTIAPRGVELKILKVRVSGEQKTQLANLGFVEGAKVTVVSENNGNLIVNVKDSRIAIGEDISRKITVAAI